MKLLNYADADGDDEEVEVPLNKFFAAQKADQAKKEANRADKHRLPKDDEFKYKKEDGGGKVKDEFNRGEKKLPYHNLDIIFNHKNIWANL